MGEVVAVLPALNEADALPEVLDGAPAWLDIVVVDNASTDDTAAVAAAVGARVAREPLRGYGAALQRAWQPPTTRPTSPSSMPMRPSTGATSTRCLHRCGPAAPTSSSAGVCGSAASPAPCRGHVGVANAVLARVCGRIAGADLHDIGPFKALRGDVAAVRARP